MFRHPAWDVCSHSSVPSAAEIVGTNSTGCWNCSDVSPSSLTGCKIELPNVSCLSEEVLLVLVEPLLVGVEAVDRALPLRRRRPPLELELAAENNMDNYI